MGLYFDVKLWYLICRKIVKKDLGLFFFVLNKKRRNEFGRKKMIWF